MPREKDFAEEVRIFNETRRREAQFRSLFLDFNDQTPEYFLNPFRGTKNKAVTDSIGGDRGKKFLSRDEAFLRSCASKPDFMAKLAYRDSQARSRIGRRSSSTGAAATVASSSTPSGSRPQQQSATPAALLGLRPSEDEELSKLNEAVAVASATPSVTASKQHKKKLKKMSMMNNNNNNNNNKNKNSLQQQQEPSLPEMRESRTPTPAASSASAASAVTSSYVEQSPPHPAAAAGHFQQLPHEGEPTQQQHQHHSTSSLEERLRRDAESRTGIYDPTTSVGRSMLRMRLSNAVLKPRVQLRGAAIKFDEELKKAQRPPQDRYGYPRTRAQEIGWYHETFVTPARSATPGVDGSRPETRMGGGGFFLAKGLKSTNFTSLS